MRTCTQGSLNIQWTVKYMTWKRKPSKEICLTVSLATFSLFYFYLPQNTVHNFGNVGHHVVFFYDWIYTTVEIRQGNPHMVERTFVRRSLDICFPATNQTQLMEKRRLGDGTIKRNLGSYNLHHLVLELTIANHSVAIVNLVSVRMPNATGTVGKSTLWCCTRRPIWIIYS
jgi:hypothetical protein